MLLRLTPDRGGDGTVHAITAMNDTGSNILTVFDTDMLYLGNLQGYTGRLEDAMISYANGAVNMLPVILVQVQLVRDDNSPWSEWIDERAILQPLTPGVSRLSGVGIRRALYLGTAPGNHFLAAAATKGGLASLL
jgi:hypothetical protein